MLKKRIGIISANRMFQRKALAGLMAAGASVDITDNGEEFLAAPAECGLLLYHCTRNAAQDTALLEKIAHKTKDRTHLVAIIEAPDLARTITLMTRAACDNVVVEEYVTAELLAGIAARHLYGDVFGLEKFLPWGVRIYSMLVGDYQEKTVAISTISDFAATLGVRRKYIEHIEKVVDELLMNAIYDAPATDTSPKTIEEPAAQDHLSRKLEQKAVIQYACDGERFGVAVRDTYGTLRKQTVLDYLDKCMHAESQIDRKEGGAGLGLYIVTNSVSEYVINVQPGVATEAVCLFDLQNPRLTLHNFSFFEETIDAVARYGPNRFRRPQTTERAAPRPSTGWPTGLKAALSAVLLLLIGAIGLLLWNQFSPPTTGKLTVQTVPPGARVRVNGTLRGVTEIDRGVRVTGLDSGRPHVVKAEMEGYRTAQAVIRISAEKQTLHRFTLQPLQTKLSLRSRPEGAHIFINDKDTGETTPAEIALKPETTYSVALKLQDYTPVKRTITTGGPGKLRRLELVKLQPAVDWGALRVLSDPSGARVYVDGVKQRGKTPLDNLAVAAGKPFTMKLQLDHYLPLERQIKLDPGEKRVVRATLDRAGTLSVTAKPPCRVHIGDDIRLKTPVQSHPLAVGRYRVQLKSNWPYIRHTFDIEVTHKKKLSKAFVFGFAAAPKGFRIFRKGRTTHRLGLLAGLHTLTLVNSESGAKVNVRVKIKQGKTTIIPPPS
jgi:hypothetical protein